MTEDREAAVAGHYGVAGLEDAVRGGLRRAGLDAGPLRPADLAPLDEFHMGGRAATAHVVGMMDLPAGAEVLDVGSGLGGVARYLAAECGCRVTGIDLTPAYVRIARLLTERTGLADAVAFETGSALDLPWPDARFDAAVTFHAAMNIADRPRFYGEIARVVRPGGLFASYDVLKGPADGMAFPVPWADTAATSFLVTPAAMRRLLDEAGFDIVREDDRRAVALEHHRARLARLEAADGPPPLGLHLLLGDSAGARSRNMLAMLEAGQIALAAIVARRRA